MRHQGERRDSKTFAVVDEDFGIPESPVESYKACDGVGPLAQSDPRSLFLSMSEYNKSQYHDVYDYHPATRPEQGQDYAAFAAHHTYPSEYVTPQGQMPSGLPQSGAAFNPTPTAQTYGSHDPTYYNAQNVHYPAYAATSPRPLPEILSYSPTQGPQGTKLTIYLRSVYDLDSPQVTPVIMFGHKRCQSILTKTVQQGQPVHYALSVDVPPLTPAASPSPHVPLTLTFNESAVTWNPPSFEFGNFTYIDQQPIYPTLSPQIAPRKRKLSPQASPRRSPTKKQSLQHLPGSASAITPSSPFRRPSVPEHYTQTRRFSVPEVQQGYNSLPRAQTQQHYGPGQTTPLLQTSQSPSWSYPQNFPSTTRSPSAAAMAAPNKTTVVSSSTNATNPPLIRTSTLQQSPSTPGAVNSATQSFNPYTMYPANSKAILKIEGELNTMTEKWTSAEREAKRRLVQFRRSQTGSVISATFEAVTLETRIPNSICVSCIWWEEKGECYVTSVDTIQLLESLVGVRFTVEEKNRIRRNLEGFRPATVSKGKQDSEEFFKLIMGFPNPKPRNIEKDVKVFPWRILAGALKKIIGKYSASYSSTAGALHTPGGAGAGPSYSTTRASNVAIEHAQARPVASPLPTPSPATPQGSVYAANISTNAYPTNTIGSAGLGIGPGIPDLRVTVPPVPHQTASWQPSNHYSGDLSSTRASWDIPSAYYSNASPATGLPGSAQIYHSYTRMPSLTSQAPIPETARFVPLQQYEDHSHQTSNA